MKKINNKILVLLSAVFFLTACNKELETFAPIAKPTYPSGGANMAVAIASNPNDSLFNRMLIRSGFASTLSDTTKTFTLFAVDNAGMKIFVNAASGGAVPLNAPDAIFSGFIAGSLPVASAAGIIQYNTIGGKFPASAIPTTFPNYPLPTQIILDPTQPFVRMNTFPSKRAVYAYVNNIPLTAVDQAASNGIIHHTFTVVAPPTATLKTMIVAEPTLSYFRAAIARGDSGSVGTSRFDSLFNYGVTNMTVLAPNNAAMQPVLFGVIYSTLLSQGVPQPTAFAIATSLASTPAGFNALPVATVRGIMAYHILASNKTGAYIPDIRTFAANYSTTPSFVKTLVNSGVAVHPGILAQATFTGPSATALMFTGLGTFPPGGGPYTGAAANTIKMDQHAVNGVYHIIDKVLFPQ